jgi:hypothetical protein
VKLAKQVKDTISSCADIGDGTKEMDLATGTFTYAVATEEAGVKDASSLGDDAADGEDDKLGEFQAPSIPNDDINLFLAQHTTQAEGTQDTSSVAARAPNSKGSTSARPLVSPYEYRGSNRNNPQQNRLDADFHVTA